MDSIEGHLEESCLDTSLLTDVSLSQDDASELEDILKINDNLSINKNKILKFSNRIQRKCGSDDDTHIFHEKKLRNDLLKMNIQLKDKSIKMDALKAENFQKIESLESKLNQALRENGLLKVQLKMEREETSELKAEFIKKLQNIESNQNYLKLASSDIQKALEAPCITEDQYNALVTKNKEHLTISDIILKCLHEKHKIYEKELEKYRLLLKEKQGQLYETQLSIDQLKDDVEKERQERLQLEMRLERSNKTVELMKEKTIDDDFKIENFDQISKKKDELEMCLSDTMKQNQQLKRQLDESSSLLAELQEEMSSLKQSSSLLTQDKDYLSKISKELYSKVAFLEGRCGHLEQQNQKYKEAREDLYEKYISSRDSYKKDYDERLREELDRMVKQMEEDIERVKLANREVSEREIRSLREARDMALEEKRSSVVLERETAKKYEDLLLDFRQKQLWSEGQLGDLKNELKVKSFEYQKLQVLLEETMNNLKESQFSYEKQQKKMEILLKEYYSMQVTFEKRNSEIEAFMKFKGSQKDSTWKQETSQMRQQIISMKNTIVDLETERNNLLLDKRQMSLDMQKLVAHNEEMVQLKKLISNAKMSGRYTKQQPKIVFQEEIS